MSLGSALPPSWRLRLGGLARSWGLLPPLPPTWQELEQAERARRLDPPRTVRPDARHDPIFDRFQFQSHEPISGFRINGLGVRERDYYYNAEAVRMWADRAREKPVFDEEYFEWVDLLESVAAAQGEFVMLELGAGYGPWLVNAVAALRQVSPIPYRLIGIEADPTRVAFLKTHLTDNGIDPLRCTVLEAAVSDTRDDLWFDGNDTDTNYGQAVSHDEDASERPGFRRVQAVTLSDLLAPLDHVDLIDMDIQGEEARVVHAALDALTEKVRRVHIGTHAREVEAALRADFTRAGWTCVHDYASLEDQETPFGSLYFVDGVQTWVNPSIPPTPSRGGKGRDSIT